MGTVHKIVCKPVYTEIPVDKPIITITDISVSDWSWTGMIQFTVNNVGTAEAKSLKIKIPMNTVITSVSHDTQLFYWGSKYNLTTDGNNIYVEIEFDQVKCVPGSSHTIKIKCSPNNALLDGEMEVVKLVF